MERLQKRPDGDKSWIVGAAELLTGRTIDLIRDRGVCRGDLEPSAHLGNRRGDQVRDGLVFQPREGEEREGNFGGPSL